MTTSPYEHEVEVTCNAEDVVVYTLSQAGVDWIGRVQRGDSSRMWSQDIETISVERCTWTGLVTEYHFAHAGISEWTCPMCRTVHTKEMT